MSGNKSNTPLLLGGASLCLLFLAGLSGGGYYYYSKQQKNSSSTTPTSQQQQQGSTTTPATATPLPTTSTGTTPLTPVTTTPATSTGTTPVTTTPAPVVLTAQQKAVYGFIPAVNIDNGGGDIRCVTDSSDPSAAREQCATTPGCIGYNLIAPYGSGALKNGGFCLKNSLDNIVAGAASTLYAAPGALPNPDIMSWPSLPGKDFVGNDIRCWQKGEPVSVAQAACTRDPLCNAVVQVAQANGIGWSGCCTKQGVDATKATNNSAVTLFVKPKVTTTK